MEISEVENIKQAKSILYRAHRVLVLTGAGVSAESGVPTFRGGGGAPIWRGMPFEQLSSAEMVEKDLPLVWEWFDYRRGKVSECEPNAAHKTLAKVQQSDQFEEFVIVTQNIDGLHARAGAESVIELHGSLWRARCLNCKARKELREIPAEMRPPICDKCSNPMRPDVILFGEAIPMDAFAQAKFFAEVCDVCIVVGTSALVYPAAELPLIAKQMGAKVIEINPVETSLTAHADLSIRGKAAEIVPQIFVEKDTSDDRVPTSETVKNTAEQNRADYQTKSPNTELETESLPAENQPISQNEMTSESHPLRVDFVQSEEFPVLNRLGMTFAPGKKQKGAMNGDWNRNMYRDMLRLREHYEIDLQVSLLEYEEFNELGLDGFEGQSQRRRISLIKFPIRDVSVPTSMKNFAKVIREIVRQLNDGKKVVVHCKGGLGRTGLTAACTIVAASRNHINSAEAIKMVRQARPGTVETSQQENFVALFEEYWQIYSDRIESLLYQQKTAVSEKILEIKSKGMIERLFRFPTCDGRYFFYLAVQEYPYSPNNDNYDWNVEPVPTFQESLNLLSNHYQFVPYKTPFIHPEYRAEFKSFLEKIIKDFSGSFTFKKWLAGLDDPVAREHTVNNSSDDNEERESNVEIDWSERPGELSDKHFLIYWQERNVRAESADAHYNLGIACDENDLPEEANAAYQKAIELDPNYLGAYYNLGCNYLRAGELDESEQSFKTAIRLAPEFAPARFMLGVVYGGLGDFEKAISTTKEGLQHAQDDPMAYFNIGNFYSHLKDYKKASEWFEKSAEIDPNAPDTFYRLGKCYRESGEKEKEFDAYLNAVELAPDFVDAMFALGTVHAYLTETAEGRQVPYFETGGELILNDPRVSFYLGLGNLAFGNVDDVRASIADLRKMDASLADQLQFFVDRFDSENKKADDILKDNIPNSAELLKEKRKSFKVKVSETIIEAQNTPELYRQVMTLLFDRGLLQDSHVPFATSSTRYLIAKEPVHPSGKNFFKFVEYAGFYMETNKSRHDAVSHLKKFVETLQVEFENLEDGIPIRVTPPVKKQNTQPTVEQRFLGSLLGLAVGDALGTTVEFKPTGTFPKVTTIIGGGPFELNAGEWTDDTSMALCLAESLIGLNGFDAFDQMRRYCRWKNEGYLSSNGAAFDIGSTVRRALEKFEQQAGVEELNAYCGSISPSTAGNGSLMRLAPVPLFFANEREKAIQYAGESSRTTHGARECVDACRYFAALIIGVIQGRPKEEILSARFTPLPGLWDVEPLAAKVAEVAEGSFKSPRPPEITGAIQGYVIPSLQAALWAFYHTDTFADGALKVVNLGYDADTYGAIYGQIAGAYYGTQSIPEEWLNLIAKRDLIEAVAEKLYKASASGG